MATRNIPIIASNFLRARWRWKHLQGVALPLYQDRRARQIVAYTLQHAPFYREHWTGYDPQNWRMLPTVDKQLMMEHFDTFTTQGIQRDMAMEVALRAERSRDFRPLLKDLTVGLSSGTSGHRGLFLVSPAEQAAWTGNILARTLHHLPVKPLRVAFFLRSNSNLYEQIGKTLITFRYFDLMLPLAQAVAALNAFQPQIVIGPPSLLVFLAEECCRGHLRICPERLIAVAEVLEAHDKARLQEVFAVPVHQIYQCTEGFLATSCIRDSLHIQEDLVALQFEPLADSEANGERGMPIITDLWRRTQPIIRYRLNDILQLDPAPCACGSTFRVIRAIEGRSDDICSFVSLAGDVRLFFPDTLRRMILLASSHITDYQIVQERRSQLHIYLTIMSEVSFAEVVQSVQTSIATTLAHYECRPATLQIEEGLLPQSPGVKRRRVRCLKEN